MTIEKIETKFIIDDGFPSHKLFLTLIIFI